MDVLYTHMCFLGDNALVVVVVVVAVAFLKKSQPLALIVANSTKANRLLVKLIHLSLPKPKAKAIGNISYISAVSDLALQRHPTLFGGNYISHKQR
jgi:hypothetical protein